MKPLFCAAVLTLLAGMANAQAQPASQQTCLQQNRVDGWKVVDDRTLIVNDRLGHKFRMSLAPGCHDLQFPMHLGFTAGTTSSLSCLDRTGFVYVPPNGGDVPQRCMITDVQPYTPAMEQADAAAQAAAKAARR